MTRYNARIINGNYKIDFETDDRNLFKMVQKSCIYAEKGLIPFSEKEMYNKAIDDFVEKLKSNSELGYIGYLDKIVDKIAEDLKGGRDSNAR